MFYINFWQLSLGDTFQMDKHDLTKWIKTSNRTARLAENGKCFYFKRLEPVYLIKSIKQAA
jgi:hypothetical protein